MSFKRRAILDVTWQMFRNTRYQQITMNDVVERAGLAKGAIYLYFKTKKEIEQ